MPLCLLVLPFLIQPFLHMALLILYETPTWSFSMGLYPRPPRVPNSLKTILSNAIKQTPTHMARTPNLWSPALDFLLSSLISICIYFDSENTILLAEWRDKSRIRTLLALNRIQAVWEEGTALGVSERRAGVRPVGTELCCHPWVRHIHCCKHVCMKARTRQNGITLERRDKCRAPVCRQWGVPWHPAPSTQAFWGHFLNKASWFQVRGLQCVKELLRLRKLNSYQF